MKLRIYGNSIRLRLSQTDVQQFSAARWVESTVEFGSDRLIYRIVADRDAITPAAELRTNMIIVRLPEITALQWAISDEVGIEGGDRPRILIEKDFACLHKRSGDSDADTYPHPMAGGIA